MYATQSSTKKSPHKDNEDDANITRTRLLNIVVRLQAQSPTNQGLLRVAYCVQIYNILLLFVYFLFINLSNRVESFIFCKIYAYSNQTLKCNPHGSKNTIKIENLRSKAHYNAFESVWSLTPTFALPRNTPRVHTADYFRSYFRDLFLNDRSL